MRPAAALLAMALLPAVVAACARGGSDEAPGTPAPQNAPLRLPNVVPTGPVVVQSPAFEALPGAQAHFGVLDGAGYRVEIPSDWNGDLVLWARGFRGFGPEVAVDGPPAALRRALVAQGYAWAASSYSGAGWAPGTGTNDTLALKEYFAREFGQPGRSYIGGDSMGGNVVVLALENFPEEFDGGLALCGVVSGGEWMDYLLAWGTLAEFLAGKPFPLQSGKENVTAALEAEVLPALGPAASPTEAGEAFAKVIRNLTGGPRPFFEEGFRSAYLSNFGLITGDPGRTLPMTRAATTANIDFRADGDARVDSDAINRGIRRLAADEGLRDAERHPDLAPTTGRLQDPLLTLHETGDLTVPVSMEQQYRRRVEARGNGRHLVQRLMRGAGHCLFSDQELVQAWDDLVGWVSTGARPAGDDILGDLSDVGLAFTKPLRAGDPELR